MKRLLTAGGFLRPPLLAFALAALAACDWRNEAAQARVAETKATEPTASSEGAISESAERRRVREMLESVVLPKIDYHRTSLEELADHLEFRIREIAPDKAVKIVVRRAVNYDENGRPMVGVKFEWQPHTWKAENISAWQALERIASDNRMTVEVDEKGLQLMPLPWDDKPVELLPLVD